MRLMLAASCLSLAACSNVLPRQPEPVVRVVETKVQVSVPCLKEMPSRPAMRTEAEILALPNYDAGFALWEDWDVRRTYIDRLEAVLAPCVAR